MYFILFQLPLCNSTFIQFPVQNLISESLFFYFFVFITEDYQLVKLYFLSTRDSILYVERLSDMNMADRPLLSNFLATD